MRLPRGMYARDNARPMTDSTAPAPHTHRVTLLIAVVGVLIAGYALWRSDNTRSLRLGEQVAIEILRKRTMEYAERPVSFTFRAFDRHTVHITQGQVMNN